MRRAQYLLKPLFFPKILITTDTGGDVKKTAAIVGLYRKTGSRIPSLKNRNFAANVQN
jgi:hypothetical protein